MKRRTVKRVPYLVTDPEESAKAAGLRYVSGGGPGIRRRRAGARFTYVDADGRRVRDGEMLARIRHMAIPPAWRDVWICPVAHGHLQASGRDARGRKQYRYHARWRVVRDDAKYARLITFALALPRLRARVSGDLRRPGLPREKVLAAVVRLLETTLIRIGNGEYARTNGSFGLTTMRSHHVDVDGATLTFEFRGKSKRRHRVDVADRRLAHIVARCQELPGQELFQYVDDDGTVRAVDSGDVNAYVREASGADFTAKDFRTWAGTVRGALALSELADFDSKAHGKRNVARAVERVARDLGNTPTVCRKCYIHPAVIETYLEGGLAEALGARVGGAPAASSLALRLDEAAVLELLQRRLTLARAA